MGADLIVNAIAKHGHSIDDLDWDAGFRAIDQLTMTEDLENIALDEWFLDEMTVPEDEGHDEATNLGIVRDHLRGRLDELRNGIEYGDRNVTHLRFGDDLIIICGGTSWGDTPDGPFDAIQELDEVFDRVLTPIGFFWPTMERKG